MGKPLVLHTLEEQIAHGVITQLAVNRSVLSKLSYDVDRDVVPVVYTFKQRGVAMRAAAQMTCVLKKGAGGWLIHSWAWTGPRPQPAAAA